MDNQKRRFKVAEDGSFLGIHITYPLAGYESNCQMLWIGWS